MRKDVAANSRVIRLRELFDAVLELPPAEQDGFVDAECVDDPSLATELRELLRLDRHSVQMPTAALRQSVLRALPDAIYTGRTLGPYTLTGELGSGGMGRVFRAQRQHADCTQTVAVKLLRQELVNPQLLKRFSVERKLLAALNHPGICRLIDVGGDVDGTPFVVMELIEGQALFDYCDQRGLSLLERLKLFRSVLAAVSHAHRHLIVHRDIKSSNILVDASGHTKLLDFGIAKMLGDDARQTATSDRYLSLGNAAPEQLLGSAHLTVACDVYALGTVLYELLSGLPPFALEQMHSGELQQQILKVPPLPMSRRLIDAAPAIAQRRSVSSLQVLCKRLTGELESVVQKCLRKEAADRYSSVEQLDQDLAHLLDNRPIRAVTGQTWYVARKFFSRHRLPTLLASLLLLAITLVVVSVFARNLTALRERDRAQQALQILREAFLAADPARVAGEDVRVREVLDAALPALEARFELQPELYASLASSIAEVQLKIGQSTAAAALFDRAADAARRGQLDHIEHAGLLVLRARALHAAGEFERARQSLAEALPLLPEPTSEWKIVQASTLSQRGEYPAAIELLRHAIRQTQSRGAQDEWANMARLRLADALQNSGEGVAALRTLDRTLAWQQRQLTADHPRIALTRLQRVIQLQAMGRAEVALDEARQVRSHLVATYGSASPFAAKAGMVLANSLSSQGRYPEAAAAYTEVADIFMQQLGERHPNTIRARYNLAAMLATDPDRHQEALELFRLALATGEARLGVHSNAVIVFRYAYAEALLARGEPDRALDVLTTAGSRAGLAAASEENRSDTLALLKRVLADSSCTSTSPNSPSPAACLAAHELLAAPGAP